MPDQPTSIAQYMVDHGAPVFRLPTSESLQAGMEWPIEIDAAVYCCVCGDRILGSGLGPLRVLVGEVKAHAERCGAELNAATVRHPESCYIDGHLSCCCGLGQDG